MKVWVGIGQTESGDDVGPYVWDHQPSEEEQLEVLIRDIPEEVEAECISVDGRGLWRVEYTEIEGAE